MFYKFLVALRKFFRSNRTYNTVLKTFISLLAQAKMFTRTLILFRTQPPTSCVPPNPVERQNSPHAKPALKGFGSCIWRSLSVPRVVFLKYNSVGRVQVSATSRFLGRRDAFSRYVPNKKRRLRSKASDSSALRSLNRLLIRFSSRRLPPVWPLA